MITKEGFVEMLQEKAAELNIKMSKETSWKLFKATIDGITTQVLEDADNKISLSGIGNFEMIKAAARGTKKGVVDYVPRMRWRASTRIDSIMEEATGQVPDPEKRAARRAEMEKNGTLRSNLPVRTPKVDADAGEKADAAKDGKDGTSGASDAKKTDSAKGAGGKKAAKKPAAKKPAAKKPAAKKPAPAEEPPEEPEESGDEGDEFGDDF